jgi:predicted GIY-YIG superfamily endonuclease
MNFRVYILHSHALDQFYVGFTTLGPLRVRQHRRKHQGWTGQANDWLDVFSAPVETRAKARALEKQSRLEEQSAILLSGNKLGHSSTCPEPLPPIAKNLWQTKDIPGGLRFRPPCVSLSHAVSSRDRKIGVVYPASRRACASITWFFAAASPPAAAFCRALLAACGGSALRASGGGARVFFFKAKPRRLNTTPLPSRS